MLSYQHAYHAGNPADLHKHISFVSLLSMLITKPRGLSVMETHAGRGLYDLASAEATKTGEAAAGIARVTVDPSTPYGKLVQATRDQHGAQAYPGSPFLAAHLLRAQDQQTLMELHPAEVDALRGAMAPFPAAVHHRDGYEGILALAPPTPRRGLVLIDPSYEVKTEYAHVAQFTRALMAKWAQSAVLIWYPILKAARHHAMIEAMGDLPMLRHEVGFDLKEGKGMMGSGLILINPPYQAETAFQAAIDQTGGLLKA